MSDRIERELAVERTSKAEIYDRANAESLRLKTLCAELAAELNRQHEWHLQQTERSPVFFGDTIGQVNADEYAESEMAEKTHAALAKAKEALK